MYTQDDFPSRQFASDNNAGVHPEVFTRMAEVNFGHASAYGHDDYTQSVLKRIANACGSNATAALFFIGTAANVVSAALALRPFDAVVCGQEAHLYVDEGGAPERWLGCKLIPVPTKNGKLAPEAVRKAIKLRGDEHTVVPRLLSLTQPTEMGTCYSLDELNELVAIAHDNEMLVHMDGARLANAAVFLNCSWQELTEGVGIDLLSLGGTKNGLMCAEALVVLNDKLSTHLSRHQKQAMQLASKMRFLAAQFDAYLENDLWKRSAQHANACALELASKISGFAPELSLAAPVEANGLFVRMHKSWFDKLQEIASFYPWNEADEAGFLTARWMCAFDTQMEDIDRLVNAIADLKAAKS